MTGTDLRQFMNIVHETPLIIDEGVIDSIRKWISGLASPIRARGNKLSASLQSALKQRYGASVPAQVQSSNKEWPWSKMTYADLYKFAINNEFTDDDIDRALKNPIVTNNLNALLKAMPTGTNKPSLPLKAANIKSNLSVVSTMIDKQTQQYLSKAIALAVIDGLAYIQQEKVDKTEPNTPEKSQQTGKTPEPEQKAQTTPSIGSAGINKQQELAATIAAIKQGLEKMQSAGE